MHSEPAPERRPGLTSVVYGIVSLLFGVAWLFGLGSLIGTVFGVVSILDARENGGRGILGALGVVVGLSGLVLAVRTLS